jgi:hypothetical protein
MAHTAQLLKSFYPVCVHLCDMYPIDMQRSSNFQHSQLQLAFYVFISVAWTLATGSYECGVDLDSQHVYVK